MGHTPQGCSCDAPGPTTAPARGSLHRADGRAVRCLLPRAKRGVAVHTAQACDVLDAHNKSSWWYSWGLGTGFDGSFCDAPDDAAARARASMDFVPMFWGEGHINDFLAAPEAWHHELDRASYLLTFNEPEFAAQANISPRRAAQLWPILVEIAQNYSLELVAPCVLPAFMASGGGRRGKVIAALRCTDRLCI